MSLCQYGNEMISFLTDKMSTFWMISFGKQQQQQQLRDSSIVKTQYLSCEVEN